MSTLARTPHPAPTLPLSPYSRTLPTRFTHSTSLGLHVYFAPHLRPKSPYVVGVEVFYAYANLVMKMMRVHDEGFANHLDHQHAMHSYVPAALRADVPLFTFPANLFRWAWIVFQTRQKRLFNWWCARCGPYPHLVVDVCHGINALRRTTTHDPTEVGRFRPLSSLSLPSGSSGSLWFAHHPPPPPGARLVFSCFPGRCKVRSETNSSRSRTSPTRLESSRILNISA